MVYLGDQHSAWDSGTPILLTSYSSGFTITADDFNEKWKIPSANHHDPGVIISRPRDDWTVENQNNPNLRLCLRAPTPTFEESIDGVYIYNVSKLFEGKDSEFKLVFTRTCFGWSKNNDKKWYEVIPESIDEKNMIVPTFNNSTASGNCVAS
jgi:hypothetical protein